MAANDVLIQQSTVPSVLRIPIEELPAHLATLEVELEGGRYIELVRDGNVIADVRAPATCVSRRVLPASERPDFMARMKARWGDKPLNVDTTAWIREDRDGDEYVP